MKSVENLNKKDINVAVFSLAYYPFEGGAEVALREFSKRLPFLFKIFTNRFNSSWATREEDGNVEIIRTGRGKSGNNYYGGFFRKLLYIFSSLRLAEYEHKKKPFQVIWGMMASYGGLAALLFKLRHPKIPFILTLQEGDSEAHILRRVWFFYPIWRLIFKKADKVQVISSYLGEFALRHGVKEVPEIVPNGVDLERFKYDEYAPGIKRIITTSRLVKKNGVDILLKAIAELPRSRKGRPISGARDYVVEIVGGGPEEQSLRRLAMDLGISHLVKFLGQIDYSEIPKFIKGAYVFVRPSRSEGLGSSFLEAMAMGVPIIAPRVGGIKDFLENGRNGLEMKPENHIDLSEKLAVILNDENLREELSVYSKNSIRNKYGWENLAHKMQQIFENLNKLGEKRSMLIATGIYPPDLGGPAEYARKLAEVWSENYGFEVKVLTFTKGLNPSIKNTFLVRGVSINKTFRHLNYFFEVLRLGKKADFILVLDTFSAAFPCVLANIFLRKVLVIRTGGDFLWERAVEQGRFFDIFKNFYKSKLILKDKIIKSIMNFSLKLSDKIIFSTQLQKQVFLNNFNIQDSNSCVISNPYQKISIEERRANRRLKQIIYAGRFLKFKNIESLIAAFSELTEKFPDFSLKIFGEGPNELNLRKRIENLGLLGSKIEICDPLRRENFLEVLKDSYLYVLPSLTDISPNSILDCLATGTPFLLTKENGFMEFMEKEAIVFNPLDNSDLKDKIEHLLNKKNYEHYQKIIKRINYDKSWEDYAGEVLKIFEKNI